MKRLRIEAVSKRYRRQGQSGFITPVNKVSIEVDSEEMVVLLGPSGCGKTTLLRCVAGLEQPDEGEIFVNDQLVFSSKKNLFVPPEARPISMVFQSYALWPHMTVFDNVAYPLHAMRLSTRDIKTRVEKTLEAVGLGGLERQFPAQMSGGQQQRVALARALVRETGVILFDEPLSNVDAVVREQLREELSQMQAAFRFSGLYVTHDQTEAMAVGDRIAILNAGSVEQIGSPEEIYNRPVSRGVGSFIGAGNILHGTIGAADGDNLRVDTEAGDIRISRRNIQNGMEPRVGQKAALLIRPEVIAVSSERPVDGQLNTFEARLQRRLFLGAHWELLAKIGQKVIRIWVHGGVPPKGASVWLSISPSSISIIELGDERGPTSTMVVPNAGQNN